MPGRLDFEFRFSRPPGRRPSRERTSGPLHLLVLGDFSGRGADGVRAGEASLRDRRPMAIDPEQFEGALARLAPRLSLPPGEPLGAGLALEFRALDDFHPDRLYERLDLFRPHRELRRRVLAPATAPPAPGPPRRHGREGEPASREDDRAAFERLLGRPASTGALAGIDLGRFLERVVGPHVVSGTDPDGKRLAEAVDDAASVQMRALLHHPEFRRLEATWRSLRLLVERLPSGDDRTLHLLDVTRPELAADVGAADGDLARSEVYRLLAEAGTGLPADDTWSLIVGLYTFGEGVEDSKLLAALGSIASRAGSPFLAGADPRLVGCRSLADSPDPADWTEDDPEIGKAWEAVRRSPGAPFIGLALPRLLLRLPYGTRTDPAERFSFEEMPDPPKHEAYLWGNPALACALILGRSFLDRGGFAPPGDDLDLADLPAHSYVEAGTSRLKPCAEVCLTERAALACLKRGVMALQSRRDRNAVHLAGFYSVADPPAPLSGPWA